VGIEWSNFVMSSPGVRKTARNFRVCRLYPRFSSPVYKKNKIHLVNTGDLG
jgi:hypothetical protein